MDSLGRRPRPSLDFPVVYSLLFFLGAVIGYGFEKASPKKSEEFTFPVASGLIAGGSLMAVVVIFWENGPQMLQQLLPRLFHH